MDLSHLMRTVGTGVSAPTPKGLEGPPPLLFSPHLEPLLHPQAACRLPFAPTGSQTRGHPAGGAEVETRLPWTPASFPSSSSPPPLSEPLRLDRGASPRSVELPLATWGTGRNGTRAPGSFLVPLGPSASRGRFRARASPRR